jgi:peptide/nickel transport system permease protein
MTHILRLISLPLITVIGLQMGSLLSGAIITEMIFSWDGVGKLLIDSIHQRDYPLTQAAVFFISLSYVTINYLLEFLYPLLDSRVKCND